MTEVVARSHAAQYHAHCPWSELRPEEGIVIERGEGCHLWDSEGKKYFDAISGGWNVALGYSCQPVISAACDQLQRLPYAHTLYNRTTQAALDLSERLRATAPFSPGKVVYANSGSEAVEAAVKMAWLYHASRGEPTRRKILSRHGSVHGSTIFTSCLGGLGLNDLFGPEDRFVRHVDTPNYHRASAEGESEAAFCERMIQGVRDVIAEEGAANIAAFLIEPIAVTEGFQPPPASYFDELSALLAEHDVLLIFDEVITGFGRTGQMYAAELLGCQPDLMVLGKGLTSGYAALGAVVPSQAVSQAVDAFCAEIGEFPHAHTTAMHPVAMRVALAVMDELASPGFLAAVQQTSAHLQQALRSLCDLPIVSYVDGLGMGGGVHLASSLGEADQRDLAFEVARRCRQRGYLIHGQYNSIILAPPLIATQAEIDDLVAVLRSELLDLAGA